MKTDINIYLSSTDFHEETDTPPDCSWKSVFETSLISICDRKFDISFHDPLQNISDRPEIVEDDIKHILDSNFVVVYLPKSKLTIGTIMEIQYSCICKSENCVILIDPYKVHRNHPWIKYWVKHIADNELDAAHIVMNILGNGNFNNLKEG